MAIKKSKNILLCSCAGFLIYCPSVAFAQQAGEGTESDRDEASDLITVTASRISREGYNAPTPTTVIGESLIKDTAQVNIAGTINQLPSLGAGITPRNSSGPAGGGLQGVNFLNLRGLGSNRTLVMLDGRRVVPAAGSGQVDINLLPTTLLRQVEIVTGGASAAWGSDAVAGVVNFTLDSKFTGLRGAIQGGISDYGDGEEYRIDLGGGTAFAGGRGHILASVSYAEIASIDRADSRDWYRGTKVATNPAWTPTNGEPQRITRDNTGLWDRADPGVIITGPLRGTVFNNDGTLATLDIGTPSGSLALGSTSYPFNDLAGQMQLTNEVEQLTGFLRVSYDVVDNLNVYGEFMYGDTRAQSISVPFFRGGLAGPISAPTFGRDNPFVPAALAAAMDANGLSTVRVGLTNLQLGRASPINEREVKRYVIGGDLTFGETWQIAAYYQRGESDFRNSIINNPNRARYNLAIDAVLANGTPACRSGAAGCAPLNVFGNGVASQAAIDYIVGTAVIDNSVTQDVAAITASGDLFDLPAGPISVAFGVEYRDEQIVSVADPTSQTNGWWVGNFKNAAGGFDVADAFFETVIPVFRDSVIGEALDLNLAVRVTDYSTSGMVATYKLGATYDIGAGLRFRGTLSRDIRGPNLAEFFAGGSTNSVQIEDPFVLVNGLPDTYSTIRTIGGNPNLAPEVADSFNLGLVFQPEFDSNLRIAIDYFDIDISDAIGVVTDNLIPLRCFQGDDNFCALISRDAQGRIDTLTNGPVNFARQKMRAIDFELAYGIDIGTGRLDLRTLWTHTLEHFTEDPGTGAIDILLGEFDGGAGPGGPIAWRGFTTLNYAADSGLSASLRYRYFGPGVLDADWVSGVDIDNNRVSSVGYFDLTLTQALDIRGIDFELFGSIDNLFDAAPPRHPAISGPTLTSIGVSNAFHDLVGRFFRAGIRFEL